jgi:hypothetical protein
MSATVGTSRKGWGSSQSTGDRIGKAVIAFSMRRRWTTTARAHLNDPLIART